jgi:hypothetical protein
MHTHTHTLTYTQADHGLNKHGSALKGVFNSMYYIYIGQPTPVPPVFPVAAAPRPTNQQNYVVSKELGAAR